jgi:hypothetical protein
MQGGGDGRVNSSRQYSISKGCAPIPPFYPGQRVRRLHPRALAPEGHRDGRAVRCTSVQVPAWHLVGLPPRAESNAFPLASQVPRGARRRPLPESAERTCSPKLRTGERCNADPKLRGLLRPRLRSLGQIASTGRHFGKRTRCSHSLRRARCRKPDIRSVSAWKPGSDPLHECDCAKVSATESEHLLSLFREVIRVACIESDSIAIRIDQLKIIVAEKLVLRNLIHRQSPFT